MPADDFEIAKLANGRASQEDRDHMLANLLVHVREIHANMWSEDRLIKLVQATHTDMCSHCARGQSQPKQLDWQPLLKALIYALAAAISVIGSVVAWATGAS